MFILTPSVTVEIGEPPLQGQKKFLQSMPCGYSINLCFKVPDKMQKTTDQSDCSRLKKCPKTTEELQNLKLAKFLTVFGYFLSLGYRIEL